MPVVVPIIAAAASIAAASAGPAVAAALTAAGISISASVVGAIIGGIAALAVTFVGSAIFGNKSQPTSSSADATQRGQLVRSPVSPHQIILGRVKVSGTLIYIYCPAAARVNYASAVFGYSSDHSFAPNQLLYTAVALSSLPPDVIDLD